MYVPLWCKSSFSFLEGASHPDELIEEGHRLGLTSIAITDRDGVYGMVRAHVKARELGVKLLAGATVTVAPPGAALVPSPVGRARPAGLHHDDHEADQIAPMSLARRGRTRRSSKRRADEPLLAAAGLARHGEGTGKRSAGQCIGGFFGVSTETAETGQVV